MAAGKVRVRVSDGWAVYADGGQRGGGETVEVEQATAERWTARGWATVAADKPASRLPSRAAVRRPARPKAGLRLGAGSGVYVIPRHRWDRPWEAKVSRGPVPFSGPVTAPAPLPRPKMVPAWWPVGAVQGRLPPSTDATATL